MPFLHRYEVDTSRPTLGRAAGDLARRTLAPAVALFAVILGTGFLITGPLGDLPAEEQVSETLAADRTPQLNGITAFFSRAGNTEIVIALCVVISLLILWRTRQWWLAVIPAIAVSVQATVFVIATTIVGRPRPDVPHLDPAPPTSSYPSGHAGAAMAFYLTLAFIAQRIKTPVLRWGATLLCFLVPMLVSFARLYRGMHHLSDIVIGLINGV
ncbi:MAG TPA: phosphatase PAP2 family protein, partial [Propionicimonas sp.]